MPKRFEFLNSLSRGRELSLDSVIYPVFVKEGIEGKERIENMPEIFRYSLKGLVEEVQEILNLGIKSIHLFGVPAEKCKDDFSYIYSGENVIAKTIRGIRNNFGESLTIFTDIGFSPYTHNGHSCIVKDGKIDFEMSLEIGSKMSVCFANAGVDFVSPCIGINGQVKAIREALDENGFKDTGIMSYSAKFASSLYGPFRNAVEAGIGPFERKSLYQADFRDKIKTIEQVKNDAKEGTDIVIVKPAIGYLDVISHIRNALDIPIATYNVSGEYCMISSAFERGWLNRKKTVFELITCMKRAGADLIITYFARDLANILQKSPTSDY